MRAQGHRLTTIRWQKNLAKINTLKNKFKVYSTVCRQASEESHQDFTFKTEPTATVTNFRYNFTPKSDWGHSTFRSSFKKKSMYDNSNILMSILRKKIKGVGSQKNEERIHSIVSIICGPNRPTPIKPRIHSISEQANF